KEPVFPFSRFRGTDIILGPEMRSTGEVMGIDSDFGVAFAKAMSAAGQELPNEGTVFISVRNADKRGVPFLARRLVDLGLRIVATEGTYNALVRGGVEATHIYRIGEGRPDVLDAIKNGEIDLIINTPVGKGAHTDEGRIRTEAIHTSIPIVTTISGAAAAVRGLAATANRSLGVRSLQEYHSAQLAGTR
ncbi:MAG: carbamoyl phosphate synthase large subunit, partial [Planctomycetota bacterium]|nr:carbamoyl phosphate synthase large subunit [Planctomycetota bacterium]